jgi:hypothetical protein
LSLPADLSSWLGALPDPEATPYYQPLFNTNSLASLDATDPQALLGHPEAQLQKGKAVETRLPSTSRHNHAIRLVYGEDGQSVIPASTLINLCFLDKYETIRVDVPTPYT